MILLLTRQSPIGNAVHGRMTIDGRESRSPSSNGIPSLCSGIPTLENQQYLIPCGTYPLEVTYSPRFKRLMPLVSAVPGRSGIRFHPGAKPEHSRGCILVSRSDESLLRDFITSHAPVTLKIING